ncbi:cytochrome P450 [Bradyrhizobium sp. USDA 4470]
MSDVSQPAAHPPVTDWVNDFDHTDPQWTDDPFPIWEELRAASPVVHTGRFLGCYMPTTYEAVREIANDTEHFSSRRIIVRNVRPEIARNAAPPITSDPPVHKPAKQLLLPPFTPDAMKKLEPRMRAICNELIDGFIADGKVDAAARYSKYIPVQAIAHMLGIPESDSDLFINWIHMILELGIKDENMLLQAVQEMSDYFRAHIEERRSKPTDDLISYLMNAKDRDGQPLEESHVLGSLRLLLIAGIDTTWSAIGLLAVASRPHACRPRAADRRAGTDSHRRGGAAARLFAGDDGPRSGQGHHGVRLSGQGRQHGAAVLPGRQPGPKNVSGCRQGRDRSPREPPCRLRPRHPPLRRFQPRADGDAGRVGGMAEADPGFPA